MKLTTVRFGDIAIEESKIITMKGGILGFQHIKQYVLLGRSDNVPFQWLQAVDDGAVAFVVINSFIVVHDYQFTLPDKERMLLEIDSSDDVCSFSIATIKSKPFQVTVNLRAPVVINVKKNLGKQIVLKEEAYPIQYRLVQSSQAVKSNNQSFEAEKKKISAIETVVAGQSGR